MPQRSIDLRYWALVVVAGGTSSLALALLLRPERPLDTGHAIGAFAIIVTMAAFLLRERHIRQSERENARAYALHVRELEEANRLLKLTETIAEVGHWRVDLTSDEVFWSDGIFAIHGMEPGAPPELQEAINFFHEEDRDIVAQSVERSRATGEPFTFNARLVRADGEIRHTMSTSMVETDAHGQAVALMGVFCDRTDEEQAQRTLRLAREQAVEVANARSSFLAKMSHEIRTPMGGILGFAELLSSSPLNAEQKRHLELILSSGKTLQSLLNDILDFTKIEEGHLELRPGDVDIAQLCSQAVSLIDPVRQEKGTRTNLRIDREVPRYARLDALRLRQILGNLLSNSVKFTDQGEVSLEVARNGDFLMFSVRDTGIGVAPDMIETIFDPFRQDNRKDHHSRGGTGLGLAICRQLAELMGGELTVESRPGEGSVFTLSLPLEIASAPVLAQAPEALASTNPCKGCRCRILLAEDFDINQELICEMGRKLGLTFELAKDGQEAFSKVQQALDEGAPYSMVLMDLQMPRMTGLECARALREAGFSPEELPIIALTANAFPDDIEACLAAGMQEHLAKPLEMARLKQVMQKWLFGFADPPPAGAQTLAPSHNLESAVCSAQQTGQSQACRKCWA